ncbi:MAG: hypothetical protein MUC89_02755 [Acetobacteraceae bacterium]|jgi:hypothetical protein|nr:hypothetical protein [Acetobacteraceae bacterium]
MQAISPLIGKPQVQKGSAEQVQAQLQQKQAELPPPRAQAPATPIANPAVRFDQRLGLVVIEFLDDQGEIANSVPSPRQLKAYEAGLNMRSGPVPLPRDLPAGASMDGLAVVA